MNLLTTPSSELLRELNARAQQKQFCVVEIPAPSFGHVSVRWGVYVDGEVKPRNQQQPGTYRQIFRAMCYTEQDANNIADLLNRQQAQRADAAKQ